MNEKEKDIIRNATTSIAGILRPQARRGAIPDQDWALVQVYLKAIEDTCKEEEKGETL